jgi:hypothetical protein
MSKNIETWHEVPFEQIEQLFQLVQVQIPTASHDINFGTKSTLFFSQIFKGFKPLRENLINSLKFFLDRVFHNVNLY